MKKLLFSVLLVFIFLFTANSAKICFASTMPEQIRVVHNFARVFSTAQNLETLSHQQLDEVTIKLALLGDVFDVIGEDGQLYKVSFNHKQNTVVGYIFKAAAIDNAIKSPEKFLQTNATITTNSKAFKLENEIFTEVENLTLTLGTQVRLNQKIDAKNKYTLISFNHNGQTLVYYVKTQNLKANGVSRSVLIAITLIVVSITTGTTLYGIFKRNNKKKKN